jgi:hypothetical protein
MESIEKNIGTINVVNKLNSVSIKAGVYTAIGLSLYLILMSVFNLHHFIVLHYFNVIILFFGLRYALKHIKLIRGEIKYFEGLKAGVIVSIISVLLFNIFLLFYEIIIDPSFLTFLREKISLGNVFSVQETVIDVIGLITAEGLSSGFIMTFILMQYYKSESSETE